MFALSNCSETSANTISISFSYWHINLVQARQQNGQLIYEISGRVMTPDMKPGGYASVALFVSGETKAVRTALSDSTGRFMLKIAAQGNYKLIVSLVGMENGSVEVKLDNQQNVLIPDIILKSKSKQLKEVTVTSRKDFIENRIDRTVVNVSALLSNEGSNALEILEKTPGVSVGINGSVSFKGRSGVTIFIDGKPTYLSGGNLANYLRSLPAALLDQIELMDNPPSRYDAAGSSGVINIKTKKSKKPGFFAALSGSYGLARYGQTSESVNFNYRKNKINWFGNVSYSFSQGYRQINLNREYFDSKNELNSAFEQTALIKPKNSGATTRIGLDYLPSLKTTWGIILMGRLSAGSGFNPSTNRLYNQDKNLTSILLAESRSKSDFSNGGLSFSFNHQFDSIGKALSFDIDYLGYQSSTKHSFLNKTLEGSGMLLEEQLITDDLPVNTTIYSFKTDFTLPMNSNSRLDAGLKTSYVHTDNKADYFNVVDGITSNNYNLSNNFRYKENINAAYLNYNTSLTRRLELQSGLRIENTNSRGHQLGNIVHQDSSFTRHYTNLFPTVFLSYKLENKGYERFVISYSRRIGRPNYQDLNPFIFVSDKYTYSAGNPFLKSQFSDNYKLAYNYKSLLSAAVFYNHTSDIQSEIVRQEGEIFINGTGNIGSASLVGASLNVSLNPRKWWFFSAYAQLFRNHFEGQIRSVYLNQSSISGNGNLTCQFALPDNWSIELNGLYYFRRISGQQVNYPMGQINGGLQKKIMNNKASLRLSIRDIFKTYRSDGIINLIPNAHSSFRNRFNSQSFTLGFNYNFGKSLKETRKRDDGAEAEKERVKVL